MPTKQQTRAIALPRRGRRTVTLALAGVVVAACLGLGIYWTSVSMGRSRHADVAARSPATAVPAEMQVPAAAQDQAGPPRIVSDTQAQVFEEEPTPRRETPPPARQHSARSAQVKPQAAVPARVEAVAGAGPATTDRAPAAPPAAVPQTITPPEPRPAPAPAVTPAVVTPATRDSGEVRVLTFPSAELSIDGVSYGATPTAAPVRLPAGRHVISLSKAGYREDRRTVEIRKGEYKEIKVRLER